MVIIEDDGGDLAKTDESIEGETTDLYFGVFVGTHFDEVAPTATVAADNNWGFGFVGKDGTSGLLDLFSQIGLGFGGQDLGAILLKSEEVIGPFFVFVGSVIDISLKFLIEVGVELIFGTLYKPKNFSGDIALGDLREAKTGAMTDEFVSDASRDTIEEKNKDGMFEDGAVSRRLHIAKILTGIFVFASKITKAHIAKLASDFNKLFSVGKRVFVVEVINKIESWIEAFEEVVHSRNIDARFGQGNDPGRLEVRGALGGVKNVGVNGGKVRHVNLLNKMFRVLGRS